MIALPRQPKIDYGRISFPSNQVTLQQLCSRKIGNVKLDLECEGGNLAGMLMLEREIAHFGFSSEVGNPTEFNQLADLQEIQEGLVKLYMRYGIADGQQTAKELVRRLEELGAEQARDQLGRTR